MNSATGSRLRLDGDILRYDDQAAGWELRIAEIVAVGEYTNDSGPWFDDYFAVFVRNDGSIFEAPFYIDGFMDALTGLCAHLGVELQPGLCNSDGQTSRVMWPEHLAGQPLLTQAGHGNRSPWAGQRLEPVGPRCPMQLSTKVLDVTNRAEKVK